MSLSYVADEAEVGKLFKSKAEREAAKKKRQESRATKGSKVGKIALAPARAAFLALVSINALGLAKKLAEAWKKDKARVKKFWIKFSGKEKALVEAIEKGSKAKLGVVTAAAVIMTATPLLIAVTAMLKELKVPTDELDPAIEQGKKDMENDPEVEKDYTNEYLPEDKVGVVKPAPDNVTKPKADTTPEKDNSLLLIGGVALLMLMMK